MKKVSNVALGEVASFIRGITFKPDDLLSRDTPDAVECMRTKNVQAELDTRDVWAVPARFVNREEQFLREGDLLVSSANSWNLIGKCSWVPTLTRRTTLGGFISALRGDSERVDARYLYHWFSSSRVQESVRSCGRQTTNISNLDLERCLKLKMPLPGLGEQRRIAAILDKAEALRAKRRQTLAKLDTFTQSLFFEMFAQTRMDDSPWPSAHLSDIAELKTGFPFLSSEYVERTDSVRLCRGANVLPGRIDWSDLATLPSNRSRDFSDYHLCEGDVVMAMDRPWISEGFKIAMIGKEDAGVLLVQRVARLRARKEISPRFLYELLKHRAFSAHCKPTETTVPHISPKDIKSFSIRIPPKPLQQKFEMICRAIDVTKERAIAAHRHSVRLIAVLQHQAFRGEL